MIRSIKNLAKIFLGFLVFTGTAHAAAFQFGGLRLDAVAVTASNTTTTLTKNDAQLRITNGSTTDTQKLPDATTLKAGYFFHFYNQSTGPLVIVDANSVVQGNLAERESAFLFVTSSSTSGGPWTFEKTQSDTSSCTVITAANNFIIDWRVGPCFTLTLTQNTTLNFTNLPLSHKTVTIHITNTASNFTVAWPSANVEWPGGTAPTQSTGVHKDVITCDHTGANGKTRCSSVQNF